ncbi:HypC/HybG/HupF family hydrogenase formation chaperone [bacterium]|nr:HypC/HybG/HupF family hydrogenase formation chaperone [bacterium]
MCLAVPGRILELEGTTGRVDFGGISREADLTLLPDAVVGDYILVHARFGIQRLDEAEAQETLRLFQELADALEEHDAERGDRVAGEIDGGAPGEHEADRERS